MKTVIVADLVMSVDNVIGIAGAAETAAHGHQMALVVFGLLVSVPIIVWGSQLVIRLMDRFPFIITAGGMLLGWIAGTLAVGDPLLSNWVGATVPRPLFWGAGLAGAALVWLLGQHFTRQRKSA